MIITSAFQTDIGRKMRKLGCGLESAASAQSFLA